ncbi:hypothetical protein BT96DRAFT_1036140 [Gymnopus androsaceus JB14]|uniref:Uncharacterized protein n=1 Tax=Gymnopus androsaceus JB14 TaxID=1447944 RepID=A0A6A4GD77_9AGAR|nr:hypothetical protein BT96DRAFT_1036140 [Gymnopus androsaceus JB14]
MTTKILMNSNLRKQNALKNDICEEGGQAMIKILENGADSAKTHDTSTVQYLVGQELNRLVTEINKTRTKEFQAALEEHHLGTKSVIRAHQQALEAEHESEGEDSAPIILPLVLPPPVAPLELIEEFALEDCVTRGLQNNITGRLLCPVEFDWDNPTLTIFLLIEFVLPFVIWRRDLISLALRARCFYKGSEYNATDLDEGFLQSHLLLQVYCVIFTLPSSTKEQSNDVENLPPAKKSKKAKKTMTTRGDVAEILHMTEVTPCSIAYAAIHLHFALSDASQWRRSHNGYNYQSLWSYVVDVFEDPIDEEAEKHAKELLKWWNDPNKSPAIRSAWAAVYDVVADIIRDSTVGQFLNLISNGRLLPYQEQRPEFVVPAHFLPPSTSEPEWDASDAATLCGDAAQKKSSTGPRKLPPNVVRSSALKYAMILSSNTLFRTGTVT